MPNWLLSTVWLLFLLFPLASLWFDDDESLASKVGASLLIALFAAVYADGFRLAIRRAVEGRAVSDWPVPPHLLILLALGVAIGVVGGYTALGVVPFIVSYAVFQLPWWSATATAVLGVVVIVVVPLAGGVYGDLWVMTPVTISVALAAVLIRRVDERERARAALETDLVLSEERSRVARDVHDVLGHSLTAVVVKAELTERLLARLEPADPAERATIERCVGELAEVQAISRRALAEIRSTVGGLRAPTLADEVAVARAVLADAGVALTVRGDQAAVPEQFRTAVAWVVREAVTNVVRHSRAAHCVIELGPGNGQDGRLLRIADDGTGLVDGTEGHGLRGVRERVEAIGATLHIRSADGTELEIVT